MAISGKARTRRLLPEKINRRDAETQRKANRETIMNLFGLGSTGFNTDWEKGSNRGGDCIVHLVPFAFIWHGRAASRPKCFFVSVTYALLKSDAPKTQYQGRD